MTAVAEQVAREPGVYDDVPAEDYLRDPALSSSGARLLMPPSCPALFRHWADNPRPPSKTFDYGHAAHQIVLGAGPAIVPVEPHTTKTGTLSEDWNTNEIKAQVAEVRAAGGVPLKRSEYDQVIAMANALRVHPVACALFNPSSGKPEQTLVWQDERTDVMRRARLDWLPTAADGRRLLVGDYKTTACAEPGEFQRSAFKYGYFQQADWYLDAVTALGVAGDDPQFVWVVQEKDPPYIVTIAYADPIALRWAADRNRQAIDTFARCTTAADWPPYSTDVVPLALPGWVERSYLEETL